MADSADDPEIALQKKSRSELLRQAVMKLSPDHREIIDLIYYHEKSVDDCALILGIPAATVKTRMFTPARSWRSWSSRRRISYSSRFGAG